MSATPAAQEIFGVATTALTTAPKQFTQISETHYRLTVAAGAISLDIDRLRRERHELNGELAVYCRLPGCQTVDGALSVADFNLSSAQARSTRAKLLAARSAAIEADWGNWLEELCQRVLQADRAGQPGVSLRSVPRAEAAQTWTLGGIELLPKHPAILFGDGASGKSYLALWLAGQLSKCGINVGLFDWELDPSEHRDRMERLFGPDFPDVTHVRCDRPLVSEVDRLRRISHDAKLEYAIFDSIAFACDGPPEAAEVAAAYFRAVRQIGQFGGLHIAHITKAEGGDQKPFGSAFWHNGARSTWNVKQSEEVRAWDGSMSIGVFQRKANLGMPNTKGVSFRFKFDRDATVIEPTDISQEPGLASHMKLRDQMTAYLEKHGAQTMGQIASGLDQKVDTIKKTLGRSDHFLRVASNQPGEVTRWAVKEKRFDES